MSLLDDLKKEVGERGAQHPEQPRVETGRVRSYLKSISKTFVRECMMFITIS